MQFSVQVSPQRLEAVVVHWVDRPHRVVEFDALSGEVHPQNNPMVAVDVCWDEQIPLLPRLCVPELLTA